MTDKEENIDLIEKYLDNDLTDEEKIDFDFKIVTDESLQEQLDLQKNAIKHLNEHEKLKGELFELYRNTKRNDPIVITRTKSSFMLYAAAAITVLLITSVSIYILSINNSENLYDEYYRPFSIDDSFRDGSSKEIDSLFVMAKDLYERKNYNKAATYFESILKQGDQDKVRFIYLGNCYLNMNRTKEAIEQFTIAKHSKNSFIRQNAVWYLALIDLKNGNEVQARKSFNEIHKRGGIYAKEALGIVGNL